MRSSAVIALVALMLAGVASASRPATHTELYWMSSAPIYTGIGSFEEWARLSTRDGHYAIYYAKRCGGGVARCGSHRYPTDAYLLRRTRLTSRAWAGSLAAEAQLRPAVRPEIVRLCHIAPKSVRQELLTGYCKNT